LEQNDSSGVELILVMYPCVGQVSDVTLTVTLSDEALMAPTVVVGGSAVSGNGTVPPDGMVPDREVSDLP
jgi:hypothetical protein